MEHHAIIAGIRVVAVAAPVALPDVHLNVATHELPAGRDQHRVAEVRPGAGSGPAGVEHLEPPSPSSVTTRPKRRRSATIRQPAPPAAFRDEASLSASAPSGPGLCERSCITDPSRPHHVQIRRCKSSRCANRGASHPYPPRGRRPPAGAEAPYSKAARSAIMLSKVRDAPLGRYIPVSHSLMVCCLVPSSSESCCWVSPRWRLRARTLSPDQAGLLLPLAPYSMRAFYTLACNRQVQRLARPRRLCTGLPRPATICRP